MRDAVEADDRALTSRNCFGSLSVMRIDCGMSAAVIGEFGPSYLPGNCSLSFSKAIFCEMDSVLATCELVSITFWTADFCASVTSLVQAGLPSWRLHM